MREGHAGELQRLAGGFGKEGVQRGEGEISFHVRQRDKNDVWLALESLIDMLDLFHI